MTNADIVYTTPTEILSYKAYSTKSQLDNLLQGLRNHFPVKCLQCSRTLRRLPYSANRCSFLVFVFAVLLRVGIQRVLPLRQLRLVVDVHVLRNK